MRVVLLNPPTPRGAFTNRDLMGGMGIDDGFGVGLAPRFISRLKFEGIRLPVLALAYGAAILAEHEVTVLDLSREAPDAPGVLDRVVSLRPDWVVAASSFAYLGTEVRFLERVRAATGARRLLFGYGATHFARELLERDLAEAVCHGDPEAAFQALAKGTLAAGTPGVIAKTVLGNVQPAPAAYIEDLDTLPFPDWSRFDLGSFAYFPLLRPRPFVTMLSSRGCPYACSFCPYPVGQGETFRARSAEQVAAEMEQLVVRHGVRSILFRDPTFSLDMKRVKKLCALVIERKLPLEWGIETRLDRMDEEMIDLLGRAGCRSAEMGIDPLDEQVRRASNRRGIAPERAAQLIRRMEDRGIATAGLFVIGLPEQDEGDVHRTLDWIQTLALSYVNYEVATPFPGTALYAQAVEKGWTRPIALQDLLDGDPKLSFNGVIDLEAMKDLQDRALRRFYVRPRRILRDVLHRDLLDNVRFMATCGWKFLRAELAA